MWRAVSLVGQEIAMRVLLAVLILLLSGSFPTITGVGPAAGSAVDRSGKEPFGDCSDARLMRVADDLVAAWNAGDGQGFARQQGQPRSNDGAGWLAFTEPGGRAQDQAVENVPGLIAGRARDEDRLTIATGSISVEPLGQPGSGLYGEIPVSRSVVGQFAPLQTMLLFLDCGSGLVDGVAIRPPGQIVRTTPIRKLVSPCTEALITAINAGEERIIRTLVSTRSEAEAIPVYRGFAFALPDAAEREPLLFADVMDPVPALAEWSGHGRRLELLTYAWNLDHDLDDPLQVWATFEGIYRDGAGVAWPMHGKAGVDCANGRVNTLNLGVV